MTLTFGFTKDRTNTQYAPLAAILARYQAEHTLEPLTQLAIPMKTRDFSPADKLAQVLVSILSGCETLSQIDDKLGSEDALAAICGWPRFADQSTLSRTLDALTLKQIELLRQLSTTIWRPLSRITRHNWHGYLWLDFDLSGLPCGPLAQESHKGYFSGEKTSPDDNSHGSVPSATEKPSGLMSSQGIATRPIVWNQP